VTFLPHDRLDPFLKRARSQIAENLDAIEGRFRGYGRDDDADEVKRFAEEVRCGGELPPLKGSTPALDPPPVFDPADQDHGSRKP